MASPIHVHLKTGSTETDPEHQHPLPNQPDSCFKPYLQSPVFSRYICPCLAHLDQRSTPENTCYYITTQESILLFFISKFQVLMTSAILWLVKYVL